MNRAENAIRYPPSSIFDPVPINLPQRFLLLYQSTLATK
jgi:hypothetical protein